MSFSKLRIDDIVLTADGSDLGVVRELGATCFRLAAKRKRDQWLPGDAVESRESGIALLSVAKDRLKDAVVDIEQHRGLHNHKQAPGNGGPGIGRVVMPLLVAGGGVALMLRNRDRREQVLSTAQKTVQQVKSRVSREEEPDVYDQQPRGGSTFGATSTVSSTPTARPPEPARQERERPPAFGMPQASSVAPDTPPPPPHISEEDLAVSRQREERIVGIVTAAFPTMDLRVMPVAVRTVEGADSPTLRFTLDDTYSSDLRRDQLVDTGESEEALAELVIADLRQQIPPEQHA